MPGKPRADAVGLTLACLAALLLAASPAGYRLGVLSLQVALVYLVPAGVVLAGFGLALAAYALARARPGATPRIGMAVAALAISLAAGALPLSQILKASSVPAIHDISTDLADVPRFELLAAARRASPNGLDYEGEAVAALQRAAYPDISTLHSTRSPPDLLALAQRLARYAGWELAAPAGAGRFEATASTLLYGFKDDIVVRVQPEGFGSRLDMRSMSRVGQSDIGANAARVRWFLKQMREAGV